MRFSRRHRTQLREAENKSSDDRREFGFERFEFAKLVDGGEFDREALEAAKRADLEKSRQRLMELSGFSEDHPDYPWVERMVGDFEETLDSFIERLLETKDASS